MSFFTHALEFLLRTLFDLAIFSFMSRFILQLVKADLYNPLSQLVFKISNPFLMPLKGYIPSTKRIDTVCLLVITLLTLLKLTSIFLIQFHQLPHIGGLLVWTLADMITAIVYFFFFALLAQILIHWINPRQRHPLNILLEQITAPLMKPVRRTLKPMGGYDLTPLPVLISLQLFIMIIAAPLTHIGLAFALRP